MSFATFSEKSRRLAILAVLLFSPGYGRALRMIRRMAAALGHDVSLDVIASDAAWLDEQGLAVLADGQLQLTDRGLDAAHGRIDQPGVMRPEPGEVAEFKRLLVNAGIASAQSALRGE